MKPKSLFLLLFVALVACNRNIPESRPTIAELNNYQTEMLRYFPYFAGDTCVFKNAEQGRTLTLISGEVFANIAISSQPHEKTIKVSGRCVGIDEDEESSIHTQIYAMHKSGTDSMFVYGACGIQIKTNESYIGILKNQGCPIDDFLLQLSDTLVLQTYDKPDIEIPNGYIRLVKDHGLTDFSVDGTTIWRRIK